MSVSVTFFGARGSRPVSGSAYAQFGGDTALVVLDCGAEPILLDLGTGLSGFSRTLRDRGAFRASCLLSHYHFDHVQGLPFFADIDKIGNSLTIFAPDVGEKPLRTLYGPPFFPVSPFEFRGELEVRPIAAGRLELERSKASVVASLVPHTNVAFGYRIELGGATICYIPDHQAPYTRDTFAATALELADGADLLIHDAQYTPAEFELKSNWGHSTHLYAVDFAIAARVKRLALFHHDPSHSDNDLLAMELSAKEAYPSSGVEIFAARQGQVLQIVP